MRYLPPAFAVGVLRRRTPIEQFLGGVVINGVNGIRWVTINPSGSGYEVCLHTVEASGTETHYDLYSYPPLDSAEDGYDGEGQALGHHIDPAAAMTLAEELAGADHGKWVNFSLAGDEYRDLLRTDEKRRRGLENTARDASRTSDSGR